MLKLSGNSEYAFATENSINSNPIVYAEWNYNMMQQPYVVSTSSTSLNINFGANGFWTQSGDGALVDPHNGYLSDINPTASGIKFSMGGKLTNVYSSSLIPVGAQADSFYKMVFYVKSYTTINSTANSSIPASDITYSTASSGANRYAYYRIAEVSRQGKEMFPNIEDDDILTVPFNNSTASNVILNWDYSKHKGPIYNIYMGLDSPSPMVHVATISPSKNTVVRIDATNYISNGYATFQISGSVGAAFFAGANLYLNGTSNISTITPNTFNAGKIKHALNNTSWRIVGTPTYTNNYSYVNLIPNDPSIASLMQSHNGYKFDNFPIPRRTYKPVNVVSAGYKDTTISKRGASGTGLTSSMGTGKLDAVPLKDDLIRIFPYAYVENNGNYVESSKSYIRTYETPTSTPEPGKGGIEIDSITWKKVEVYFGAPDAFNAIRMDLSIDSSYQFADIIMSQPEIHKISKNEFYYSNYFPPESMFYPHRPGEALLNPYLKNSDKKINAESISSRVLSTKPVSYLAYCPDAAYSQYALIPHKQANINSMLNIMKYYVGEDLTVPKTNKSESFRARYNYAMTINKLVLKFSNAFYLTNADMTKASGTIILKSTDGTSTTINISAGDIEKSGLLDLYYNGLSWSRSRPVDGTYPSSMTDSGILQNVLTDINEIIVNLSLQDVFARAGSKLRVHCIEISPRLEVDISNLVESFSINKTIDDNQSGGLSFPISYINSNTATLNINNVPVYKNSFPTTIFDDIAENATFYGLMKQGVKFTGALYSPQQDFTDIIPLFVMYSDSWSISDIKNISVNLFDNTKAHLMAMQASDYLGQGEGPFDTITNLLDAVGFTDYDYDGLKNLTNKKTNATSYFWAERSQTVFEALQSYFIANQIGAFFDEYGIMRFVDIDSILDKSLDGTLNPDFAVTDINITSGSNGIIYIPNIIAESYSHSLSNKIGKVSIEYQMPMRSFTEDSNFDKFGQYGVDHKAVWQETEDQSLIYSFANHDMSDTDTTFSSNPSLSVFGGPDISPRNTLGNQSNVAFMQGELINWHGLNYSFHPFTHSASLLSISGASAIVSSASPYAATASILLTSPSAIGSKSIVVGAQVSGTNIQSDTNVKSVVKKSGAALKFTASGNTTSNAMVSTSPAASSVKVNSLVYGAGIPNNTYVSSVDLSSSPSVILQLSNKPNVNVSALTVQSSSLVVLLTKNTTVANGASSNAQFNVSSPSNPIQGLSFYSDNSKDIQTPFEKSIESIITKSEDLPIISNLYANQDSRITGIRHTFTGRVSGVSRGNRFTSRRYHALLDDYDGQSTLAWGHIASTNFFDKKLISGNNSISNTNVSADSKSRVTFDKNVVRFDARRESWSQKGKGLALIPKQNTNVGHYQQPTSASNFNYFSFKFKAPNYGKKKWKNLTDKTLLQLGLCIETEGGNLIICLENDRASTYLTTASEPNDQTTDLSKYTFYESKFTKGRVRVKRGVFDGKEHRMAVLFHNSQNFADTAQRGTNNKMTYNFVTVIVDDAVYGPYPMMHNDNIKSISTKFSNILVPKSRFGFYVRNVNGNSKKTGSVLNQAEQVYLSEIYACNWWDNRAYEIVKGATHYHWTSPTFINKLLLKSPWAEPTYYYWGPNVLTGIQIYDEVNFTTAPIIEQTIETDYQGYDPIKSKGGAPLLDKTGPNSVVFSKVFSTPFRASFAVVNKDDQLVYLKAPDGSVAMDPIALRADYVKLTEKSTMEKIIDAAAINNSIQITTQWIQSPHDAKVMLEKIALLASSFNAEVSVSIFGNPLIQTGDICQMVYSLKNIGYDPTSPNSPIIKKLFIVKGVRLNYDKGLSTELTLKPLFLTA